MVNQLIKALGQGQARKVAAGIVAAIALAAGTAAGVSAQWPTTCVELNDIVERHLGNHHNVGIYQRTFGSGYAAEQACQNDHRNNVRATFGWAIPAPTVVYVPQAPAAPPGPSPDEQARNRFLSAIDDIVWRNRTLNDRFLAQLEQDALRQIGSTTLFAPQPYYDIAGERRVLLLELERLQVPAAFARAHQLYYDAIAAAWGGETALASGLATGGSGFFDVAIEALEESSRLIGEADAELAAARAK